MDITKLSDVELKAYAYDTISIIEVNQKNLQALNAEIKNRHNTKMENEQINPEVSPEAVEAPVETPTEEVAETPVEEVNIAPETSEEVTEAPIEAVA